MYVCMFVHVKIYVYAGKYLRVYSHARTHSYVCVCVCVRMCVCIYASTYTYTYIYVYICLHTYTHINTRTHTCMPTYAHAQARTHTHTHTNAQHYFAQLRIDLVAAVAALVAADAELRGALEFAKLIPLPSAALPRLTAPPLLPLASLTTHVDASCHKSKSVIPYESFVSHS